MTLHRVVSDNSFVRLLQLRRLRRNRGTYDYSLLRRSSSVHRSIYSHLRSDLLRDPRVRLGLTPSVAPVVRPTSTLSQSLRGPPYQPRAGGGYAADSTTRLQHVEQREGDSRGMQGFTRRASSDVRKVAAIDIATASARVNASSPFAARPLPRPHEPIDLTDFLVERKAERGTSEQSAQTDPLADLPPTEPYARAKSGVDAGTQITHGDRKKRSKDAATAGKPACHKIKCC